MRGTTPTFTFNLPIEVSTIKTLYITILGSGGNTMHVVEKTLADCTKTENSVAVTLTQEETLGFVESATVEIQLRGVDVTGNAFKSQVFETTAERILKDGVI